MKEENEGGNEKETKKQRNKEIRGKKETKKQSNNETKK